MMKRIRFFWMPIVGLILLGLGSAYAESTKMMDKPMKGDMADKMAGYMGGDK